MPALGVMASFGWFGFCGWYIQRNFGFEYFGYSLPHEQGLLLIALFAPVCFIWLMILYHQRAKVSSAELERVMARFEALDVKPDEHQEQIEGVTANLREQVKLLTEASEAAAGAAEAGGETIASRIAELKEAGEAITKRSDALQAALKQPLEDFANLNEKLSVLVRDSEAEIEKQRAAAQAAVVDAQGQVHEIAKELGLSTEKLQQGSGEAAARARQAGEEITKFTKELTATLKTFAESSAEVAIRSVSSRIFFKKRRIPW